MTVYLALGKPYLSTLVLATRAVVFLIGVAVFVSGSGVVGNCSYLFHPAANEGHTVHSEHHHAIGNGAQACAPGNREGQQQRAFQAHQGKTGADVGRNIVRDDSCGQQHSASHQDKVAQQNDPKPNPFSKHNFPAPERLGNHRLDDT